MKNMLLKITKNSDNIEMLSSLIAAVGMIILAFNLILGKTIIILGLTALAVTYFIQCAPLLKKNNSGKDMLKLTITHISSIIVLAGILLSMLNSRYDIFVLSGGWLLIGICFIIDVFDKSRKTYPQTYITHLRFLILIFISIIFYLVF